MSGQKDTCVLFFVKYPAGGQAKTRLSADLDGQTAVGLYKNFIIDILAALQKLNVPFIIFFHPHSAKEKLTEWLGKKYSSTPQRGDDLGERMENAFYHAFDKNFSKAVIVGSDIPDLPVDFLEQAFRALDTNDAVVGPTSDGGYYLIGFTKTAFLPEAFQNIAWSTDSVSEQTIDILKRHKRKVYLVPQWHDVDTLADLESLLLRNKNTTFRQSNTFSYLLKDKSWNKSNV